MSQDFLQTKPECASPPVTFIMCPRFSLFSGQWAGPGSAVLPSAVLVPIRTRRRAQLQLGRTHHPHKPNRRQLVRGVARGPLGPVPRQLRGRPGASAVTVTHPQNNSSQMFVDDTRYATVLASHLHFFQRDDQFSIEGNGHSFNSQHFSLRSVNIKKRAGCKYAS